MKPHVVLAVAVFIFGVSSIGKSQNVTSKEEFERIWNRCAEQAAMLFPASADYNSPLSIKCRELQAIAKASGDPLYKDPRSALYLVVSAAAELKIKPSDSKTIAPASSESKDAEIALLKKKIADWEAAAVVAQNILQKTDQNVADLNKRLKKGSDAYRKLLADWNELVARWNAQQQAIATTPPLITPIYDYSRSPTMPQPIPSASFMQGHRLGNGDTMWDDGTITHTTRNGPFVNIERR